MKISVIIPAFNEAKSIGGVLKHLKSLTGSFEIIVVDGGSDDDTVSIAESYGVIVTSSPKGRPLQMNYGAGLASGDILLFLHADTYLPENFYSLITNALQDSKYNGGCFRLGFDADSSALRFIAWFSRFPFRFFHYGDQTYFVRKEIFHRLNGYKDYPIMEDVDFWLRLRKTGKLKLLKESVTTSSRRFMAQGVIRQQVWNVILVVMFVLGAKPHKLKKFYNEIREQGYNKSIFDDGNNHVFKRKTIAQKLFYSFNVVWNWLYSNLHNTYGSGRVVGFITIQKMKAGLLEKEHPWVTGISPSTGKHIWHENIMFATKRKVKWNSIEPESDEDIISKTGNFLTAMVERSIHTDPEIPHGSGRRMPHAVNYIHGGVNYNGGYMLFNDFKDAMYHFSDKKFTKEFKRFAKEEKREITVIIRERKYDPTEFAWFVAFVRSVLPWYVNGNGPTKKRVLWGTPAPYPNVNPISGSWIFDMVKLYNGRYSELVREPIAKGKYFMGEYRGNQPYYSWLVRFHAWAIGKIIWIRGFQGGMFFTKRKKIEPKNLVKYKETGGKWRAGYEVPGPMYELNDKK